MTLPELLLIALGLAMDAFAVSICTGLEVGRATLKNSLTVGLYFGVFQAAMPLIGYLLGAGFADYIGAFDHWVVLAVLSVIGGKMIWESFKKDEPQNSGITAESAAAAAAAESHSDAVETLDVEEIVANAEEVNINTENSLETMPPQAEPLQTDPLPCELPEIKLPPAKMLPLALATSIDALAVGVTFALLGNVNITQAVTSIGVVTLGLSMIGMKIGSVFGTKFKSKAELAGGIILVLMGLKTVAEHFGNVG